MSSADDMTPDELAQACAKAMWAKDVACQQMGFELGAVSAGKARMSMTVRESMLNGHKICHGGFVFMLADSAFAYVCNGYNQFTLAQHCSISFLKPTQLGEVLTAYAVERMREGRSGIYDITVNNEAGEIVAEFRGISRTIKGTHIS